MPDEQAKSACVYLPPTPVEITPRILVAWPGTDREQRFLFYDHIEIGRQQAERSVVPGMLLIDDDTISRRHCVITQTPEGKCFVRDISRNGTRVDDHRLVPNLETPLQEEQVLLLGRDFTLTVAAGAPPAGVDASSGINRTTAVQVSTVATVLVGDIRDYTVLVRTAPPEQLQQSVARTFERLADEVLRHGGTVKEYQGDAIFAYWENANEPAQVATACRAALGLHALTGRIANDTETWNLADHPLQVDWAIATGRVLIDSFGGRVPTGLSMIGEAVVRAFRIEKLATDATGPILACRRTHEAITDQFHFRDLGEMQAKGFDQPEHVFALLGPR